MCAGDDDPLHSRAEPTLIVFLSDHSTKLFPKHLSLYLQASAALNPHQRRRVLLYEVSHK